MGLRLFVFHLLLAASVPVHAKDARKPAASADAAPAIPASQPGVKRFVVVRTFPAGALEGLDAAAKRRVNETNAAHKVKWVESFANEDKTKTFCIYEGPSAQAVRDAAQANKISADEVYEVPFVLLPR